MKKSESNRLDSCYENSHFLFRVTCVIKQLFSNNSSAPKAKIPVRSDPIRSDPQSDPIRSGVRSDPIRSPIRSKQSDPGFVNGHTIRLKAIKMLEGSSVLVYHKTRKIILNLCLDY